MSKKHTYRFLQGLKGLLGKLGIGRLLVFISKAKSEDITSNRLSNTLVEQSLALSTPEAYNPFNGGGNYEDYLLYGQDQTPSIDGSIKDAIN